MAKRKNFHSFLYSTCNVISFGSLGLFDSWGKNTLEDRTKFMKEEELEKATHIVFVD